MHAFSNDPLMGDGSAISRNREDKMPMSRHSWRRPVSAGSVWRSTCVGETWALCVEVHPLYTHPKDGGAGARGEAILGSMWIRAPREGGERLDWDWGPLGPKCHQRVPVSFARLWRRNNTSQSGSAEPLVSYVPETSLRVVALVLRWGPWEATHYLSC